MTSTKHDEPEIEEVTADIMGPFELEPGLYFNRPNGLPIRINPYLAGNLARWHDLLQQPSFRRDLHAFVTEDVLTQPSLRSSSASFHSPLVQPRASLCRRPTQWFSRIDADYGGFELSSLLLSMHSMTVLGLAHPRMVYPPSS